MQILLFFVEGFEGTHDGLCMRYLSGHIRIMSIGLFAIGSMKKCNSGMGEACRSR
jgi:hypothetical protein